MPDGGGGGGDGYRRVVARGGGHSGGPPRTRTLLLANDRLSGTDGGVWSRRGPPRPARPPTDGPTTSVHLEAASPIEASFWPVHPTIDRLLQVGAVVS